MVSLSKIKDIETFLPRLVTTGFAALGGAYQIGSLLALLRCARRRVYPWVVGLFRAQVDNVAKNNMLGDT